MTRHTNAARDLAALLADASPDVAAANAPALAALRADIAADLANAHVAAMLRTTGEASAKSAARSRSARVWRVIGGPRFAVSGGAWPH